MAIQPPILAGICVVLAIALQFLGPKLFLPQGPVLGWSLLAGGVMVTAWARTEFTRRNTTLFVGRETSTLVTTGPFRLSRNPMYLGIAVTFVALGLITRSGYYFIAAVAFVAVMSLAYIPLEERSLRLRFGAAYDDYRQKVRRWL